MRSGGGVLLVSSLQMLVGLVLLGVYEGYKRNYILHHRATAAGATAPKASDYSEDDPYASAATALFGFYSPMVIILPMSIINNIFSLVGFAGMFARLRQLVVAFFIYNLVNVVASFHIFVDVATTSTLEHRPLAQLALSGYEKAAAAFLFFDFLLSCFACLFAVKAIDEMKDKKRDELTTRNIEMGLPL